MCPKHPTVHTSNNLLAKTRITGPGRDADVSKQGRGVHVPEPHACTLTPKRRVAHVARPCAAATAAQRQLLFSPPTTPLGFRGTIGPQTDGPPYYHRSPHTAPGKGRPGRERDLQIRELVAQAFSSINLVEMALLAGPLERASCHAAPPRGVDRRPGPWGASGRARRHRRAAR